MNTQLVDSIAQLIKSLPDEDRTLLRERLLIDLLSPEELKEMYLTQNPRESTLHNTQIGLSKHVTSLNLPALSSLSDGQVIALTKLQMETSQDQRLSQLLQTQQERAMTVTEQSELEMLMEIYQAGLLRKAQALNESVKRGLRQPLSA
jgi:hypothetical protein